MGSSYRSMPHKKTEPGPSLRRQARERGALAIRRKLSPDSYETIAHVKELLAPELKNVVTVSETQDMAVTIVGATSFSKVHKCQGPRTEDIVNLVESTKHASEVRLGRLAIFGLYKENKLGIKIKSPELHNEVIELDSAFERAGFPLEAPWKSSEYVLHLTLGTIWTDHIGHFNNHGELHRLSKIAGLSRGNDVIASVMPVAFNLSNSSSD